MGDVSLMRSGQSPGNLHSNFEYLIYRQGSTLNFLIQRFAFDEPWGVWEVHPEGDEFVYLLSGDTEFSVKMPGEAPRTVRVNQPGSYVMVPKGAWHTATPHAPTTMLFVTPGEGTLNQQEPE